MTFSPALLTLVTSVTLVIARTAVESTTTPADAEPDAPSAVVTVTVLSRVSGFFTYHSSNPPSGLRLCGRDRTFGYSTGEGAGHGIGVMGKTHQPDELHDALGACKKGKLDGRSPTKLSLTQQGRGYIGEDQITYELKNADGSTEAHTVTITVTPRPAPPEIPSGSPEKIDL